MPLKKSGAKLFLLLSVLDKKAQKELGKFLESPFFNTSQTILKLYHFSMEHYPSFPEEALTKEILHAYLFPDKKKFQEKRIRDILSDLSLLVEQFFVINQLRSNESVYRQILIDAFEEHQLAGHFDRMVQLSLEKENKDPVRSAQRYLNVALLYNRIQNHPFNVTKRYVIEDAMYALDRFFVLIKLQLVCDYIWRAKLYNDTFEADFIDEIKKRVEEDYQYQEKEPVFAVYLHLIKLLEQDTDLERFHKTKKVFEENMDLLHQEDRAVILRQLNNYVVRAMSAGDSRYTQESWALFQIGLEHQILSYRKRMTDTNFTNIAINGSRLGYFVEVEKFILKYASYLDEELRSNAIALSRAYMHFFRKTYDDAIFELQTVHYVNVTYAVRGRSLLLRTYYEVAQRQEGYPQELHSHIEAFERYLKRNKRLSESKRQEYLAFVSITRALTRKIEGALVQAADLEAIKKRILETEKLVAREWLLEKVKEALE